MKDEALERVWKIRKEISKRCGFDSHRLVKYLQDHKAKRQDEHRANAGGK